MSPFPPEKDGVGDYTNLLATNIKGLCKECKISVIARKMNNLPHRSKGEIAVFRSWDMSTPISSLRSIFAILRDVISIRPNVVHLHYGTTRQYGGSAGEPFILILLVLRLLLGVKTVVSLHGFWTLDEAKLIFEELTGRKLFSTLYKYYYLIFVRLILNLPDVLVNVVMDFNSPLTGILSRISGRGDIVEIVHGVPTPRERIEKEEAKRRLNLQGKFVILLFGFIRRGKGYEDVLKGYYLVLKKHSSFKSRVVLLVVGAATSRENLDYVEELKRTVSKFGLDCSVSFCVGYLPDSEIPTYICAADVMMLTYSRHGGPSGVMAKALAYGTPVIINDDRKYVTCIGKLPAIVLENNDESIIADCLETLITDKRESDELQKRARVYNETYSFTRIANQYLSLYSKIVH